MNLGKNSQRPYCLELVLCGIEEYVGWQSMLRRRQRRGGGIIRSRGIRSEWRRECIFSFDLALPSMSGSLSFNREFGKSFRFMIGSLNALTSEAQSIPFYILTFPVGQQHLALTT